MGVVSVFPISFSEIKVISKIVGAEIIDNSEILCSLSECKNIEKYTGSAWKFRFDEKHTQG